MSELADPYSKPTMSCNQNLPQTITMLTGMTITLVRPSKYDSLSKLVENTLRMLLGVNVYFHVVPTTQLVLCDQQVADSDNFDILFAIKQQLPIVTLDWLYDTLFNNRRASFTIHEANLSAHQAHGCNHYTEWNAMKELSNTELGTDRMVILRDIHDGFLFDISLARLDRATLEAEHVQIRIFVSILPHQGGPVREYCILIAKKKGITVLDVSKTTIYGHSSDALVPFKQAFELHVGYSWDDRHQKRADKTRNDSSFTYMNRESEVEDSNMVDDAD